MRRHTLAFLLFISCLMLSQAWGQMSFKWHGFVNPHYYADSRSVVGGREDMMLFYPKPVVRDSLGRDINDGWQADMLAITARLNLRISGPDMMGAKTSAFVEGDFTGSTNATIDNLRLRHAYIQMDWGSTQPSDLHSQLIVGQYWYPMQIHEIMPMTNPLNMGSPFALYARQPQIRYSLFYKYRLKAVAAASWQLDNMSQGLLNGVITPSTQFARHSMVPEICLQLWYLGIRPFSVGAAVNARTIQPVVPDPTGQLHTSLTYSLFGRAEIGSVTVKAQTLLNNSLYECCSLGGYLLIHGTDGSYSFRDWHFNTVWIDVEQKFLHWRPGIFMGYARRGDIVKPTEVLPTYDIVGRGADLLYLWRVQPRITYTTGGPLSFTAEAEYTHAGYAADPVGNLRLSLSMVYSF